MGRFDNKNETAFELHVFSGVRVYPRTYCDDPDIGPVGIYLNKSPVCKLVMTPIVCVLGETIQWDVSLSRSATSTISEFDLSFGGPTNTGDIVNGDFQAGPKAGSVIYDDVGFYTAELTVTDLLNDTSQPCKVDIQVVKSPVSLSYAYIGTDGQGVFRISPDGTQDQVNNGLTGGHLNVRSIKVDPINNRTVWIATADGVGVSYNDGDNWTLIDKTTLGTPVNTAGDDPAPVTGDLDQRDLAFDLVDPNIIYLVRTLLTSQRVWLYKTEDYGQTWTNTQVRKPS